MRKWFALLTASLLALALLAGCGGTSSSGSAAQPDSPEPQANTSGAAPAEEVVNLKVGGISYGYTETVIDYFNENNPDILVEVMPDVGTLDDGSLQAVLQSGLGPDLAIVGSGPGRINPTARDGLILPLNDVYDELGMWDRYQDFVIDQLTKQDPSGNVYEVVEGLDVFQIYYNKAMFEEYSLEPPTTWDEFYEICDTFLANGITPIGNGFRGGLCGGWLWGQVMEANVGMERMSAVLNEGAKMADYEGFENTFQMLIDFADKGYINAQDALALDANESSALFYNEVYPMFGAANAVILTASHNDDNINIDDYGAFYLPSLEEGRPGRPTMGLAHSWVINAQIDPSHMDAAVRWLDYVSGPEYCKLAVENGGNLIPAIKDMPSLENVNWILRDAHAKLENGAGYNPSVFLAGGGKQAWYENLQAVLNGSMTPAQAVESIDQAVTE